VPILLLASGLVIAGPAQVNQLLLLAGALASAALALLLAQSKRVVFITK
jgi:hypothetical protein